MNSRRTVRESTGIALVAVFLFSSPAAAQAPPPETGSVAGFILDPLDGGVADVRVFLTDIGTNTQHTGRTNQAGYFDFEKIATGTYRVTAEASFVPVSTVTVGADERVEHTVRMKFEGRFEAQIEICAECVVTPGTQYTAPESLRTELELDDEWLRNQPVVGPRMPASDRLRTIPYPERLREKKIEGTAVVEGRIGTDGFPTSMRVVSSDHPDLGTAVMAALKELQWEPARVRGVAVEYPLTVTVKFSLRRESP